MEVFTLIIQVIFSVIIVRHALNLLEESETEKSRRSIVAIYSIILLLGGVISILIAFSITMLIPLIVLLLAIAIGVAVGNKLSK